MIQMSVNWTEHWETIGSPCFELVTFEFDHETLSLSCVKTLPHAQKVPWHKSLDKNSNLFTLESLTLGCTNTFWFPTFSRSIILIPKWARCLARCGSSTMSSSSYEYTSEINMYKLCHGKMCLTIFAVVILKGMTPTIKLYSAAFTDY